jgi:hypothetical protein
MKTTWSAVVVFECEETRNKAVAFCDRLVDRFWTQMGFEISWWSYERLNDPVGAGEAATKAAQARLIIFATRTEAEIPLHVIDWVDKWTSQRSDREGALVALGDQEGAGAALDKEVYLRDIAHRAGMDFLTRLPQNLLQPFPDSPESCAERAHQHTTIMDDILHRGPPSAPPSLRP